MNPAATGRSLHGKEPRLGQKLLAGQPAGRNWDRSPMPHEDQHAASNHWRGPGNRAFPSGALRQMQPLRDSEPEDPTKPPLDF